MADVLFPAKFVAFATQGTLHGDQEQQVTGVITDSREAGPGDLFVALPGEHVDGHDFIDEALARGAAGLLISKPVWERVHSEHPGCFAVQVDDTLRALGQLAAMYRTRFEVKVTGITGSAGKTTTKDMVASILSQSHKTLKSEGNLNTEVGLPLTLFKLRDNHEHAVLEMGMRGLGEIEYLASLSNPEVGVVTNIQQSHLERLGTVEHIVQAKSELLEALPDEGCAILNEDDPKRNALASHTTAKIITFGLSQASTVRATGIELEAGDRLGMRFELHTPVGTREVWIPVAGKHHVYNALAAAAVAHVHGVTLEDVEAGLANTRLAGMRMECHQYGDTLVVNDAYNANPSSMKAAMRTCQELADKRGGRLLCLFGDMLELGPASRRGHLSVGRVAAQLGIARLVTYGDRAGTIAEGARGAGFKGDLFHAHSIEQAAEYLLANIKPSDVVLIKGSRGMEMERAVPLLEAGTRR